eukprot:276701_1
MEPLMDRSVRSKPSIARLSASEQSHVKREKIRKFNDRGRWLSPEFTVYYAVAILSLLWLAYEGYSTATKWESDVLPRYPGIKMGNGWFSGWKVDVNHGNGTNYWGDLRGHFHYMFFIATIHLIIGGLIHRFCPSAQTYYQSFAGLAMLTIMHRLKVAFFLGVLIVNFSIAFVARDHWLNPVLTFGVIGGEIIAMQLTNGFGDPSWSSAAKATASVGLFASAFPWRRMAVFAAMRMISFNLDYFWAIRRAKGKISSEETFESHCVKCEECRKADQIAGPCYKWRSRTPASLEDYTFVRYVAYVTYAPLVIFGPVISFNAFNSFLRSRHNRCNWRMLARYAAGVLFAGLMMELMLQYFHPYVILHTAFNPSGPSWHYLSWLGPAQVLANGYWQLLLFWMQLFFMWRYLRLCWLIRLVYIPMGGSRVNFAMQMLSVAVCFQLIVQLGALGAISLGSAVTGFALAGVVIVETLLERFTPTSFRTHWTFRHVCACGYAVVFTLIIVGFAVAGTKNFGREYMWLVGGMLEKENLPYLALILSFSFACAQIAYEVRDTEKRRVKRVEYERPDSPEIGPVDEAVVALP